MTMMIAFRKAHPILRRRTFFTGGGGGLTPEILWHGVEPAKPDFSENSHCLAFALDGRRSDRPGVIDRDIYVAMNAYDVKPLDVRIPACALRPPLAAVCRYGPSLSRRHRRREFGTAVCLCLNATASKPTQPSFWSPSSVSATAFFSRR